MFEILDRQTTLTGCWFLMAGVVYYFFGLETQGKTNEQIDRELGVAHA
jgi:putative MFS transporter